MNILLITPDAVGSTLLQRLITIFMQLHELDQPVINLHELTNGLALYFSPEFNQEIVSKKTLEKWGYFQSLSEIVDMLEKVKHHKVSRLAHYHLRNRGDDLKDQIPFYQYLNDNFYIISCRRRNIFEHALSLVLARAVNKLNVHSFEDKIHTFAPYFRSKITLHPESFQKTLDAYKQYVEWAEKYFNINSYFTYEDDLPTIEKYILNLPVFSQAPKKITWHDKFGIDFETFNRCHYLRSNIGSLYINGPQETDPLKLMNGQEQVKNYQRIAPAEFPPVDDIADFDRLRDEEKNQLADMLLKDLKVGLPSMQGAPIANYLQKHDNGYQRAQETIEKMVSLGIMINGLPIKKQTMAEKKAMIANYDQCKEIYDEWVLANAEFALGTDHDVLESMMESEQKYWTEIKDQDLLLPSN